MKRISIVFGGLLLIAGICLAVFWWRLSHKLNRATNPARPKTSQIITPTPTPVVPPKVPQSATAAAVQAPGGVYEPSDLRWQWWREEKAKDQNFEWKMPITFYGKVVDETGVPIGGATVYFQWNDTSAEGTSYARTVSDGSGSFSLKDVTGKLLEVKVSKEGYEPLNNRSDFEYAAFFEKNFYEPDPNNPVIFRLWKKRKADPLIVRQALYGFKPDGTPYVIDLMTGKKREANGATGDLAVRITRPANPGPHFAWSVTLEGIGGTGFIEIPNDLKFEAPENGYKPRIEYKMDAGNPNWSGSTKKEFFVRSRNGQIYGRIEADVIAKYNDQAAIDMRFYVNPNWSRNLEYDPAKQINPR